VIYKIRSLKFNSPLVGLSFDISTPVTMAPPPGIETTFEPAEVIQPFYTGGSVAVDQSGRILATCLGEDVLLVDLNSREQLARIEGVQLSLSNSS
jgi:hypothetical protein